jgi:hypothetical protein
MPVLDAYIPQRALTPQAERTLLAACTDLQVAAEPSLLHRPNVTHLATGVHGMLTAPVPLLDVAALVHPLAAAAGSPTPAAIRVVSGLEGMSRGGCLGPVGWIDGHGNGEDLDSAILNGWTPVLHRHRPQRWLLQACTEVRTGPSRVADLRRGDGQGPDKPSLDPGRPLCGVRVAGQQEASRRRDHRDERILRLTALTPHVPLVQEGGNR